ncbi:MAG TPA: SigE family RNA polymerase sigma factor [Mycobacteriales bacterium]|nr:SigE family RNA polymerase sigma factor [Mycobacteriales bacterium]
MDDSSFREYVAARGLALTRTAYLLCGNQHDAADLVQTALSRAYADWGRVSRMGSPDAYIRRIMANQRTSWWRSRRREHLTPGPLLDRVAEDRTDNVAIADLVRAAVRALPPKQRAAIVFRYFEDLDDAAIAYALDCSPATVRSQISRALTQLRQRADLSELVGVEGS